MPSDKETSPSSKDGRAKQFQQLEHDMKTYLSVVSMGVQALKTVREEPNAFAELCDTIENDGVKPLEQIIAEIVALALAEPN